MFRELLSQKFPKYETKFYLEPELTELVFRRLIEIRETRYASGRLQSSGILIFSKRHGEWNWYYDTENNELRLATREFYDDGILKESLSFWSHNGKLWNRTVYEDEK